MLDYMTSPQALAIWAGLAYTLGYLIINQVWLRLLVLLGTCFYIAYYFSVPGGPLWEAFYTSIILGLANLTGITLLMIKRSRLSIPRPLRDLYPQFDHLPPGDFALVARKAERIVLDKPAVATREGEQVPYLIYVLRGEAEIEKGNTRFTIPAGAFLGEVSLMLGSAASATTTLPTGAEILRWERGKLERMMRSSPQFRLALEAAIAKDMARKVGASVASGGAVTRSAPEAEHAFEKQAV